MVMTLEADYAVRIVEYLTKNPQRRDAKTISEETRIPLRFSLKILRELVAEGLVCSYKGAKGGYPLAKPPEEITLRQVIELVEGPYMLSRCQKDEYSCCLLYTSPDYCVLRFTATQGRFYSNFNSENFNII